MRGGGNSGEKAVRAVPTEKEKARRSNIGFITIFECLLLLPVLWNCVFNWTYVYSCLLGLFQVGHLFTIYLGVKIAIRFQRAVATVNMISFYRFLQTANLILDGIAFVLRLYEVVRVSGMAPSPEREQLITIAVTMVIVVALFVIVDIMAQGFTFLLLRLVRNLEDTWNAGATADEYRRYHAKQLKTAARRTEPPATSTRKRRQVTFAPDLITPNKVAEAELQAFRAFKNKNKRR